MKTIKLFFLALLLCFCKNIQSQSFEYEVNTGIPDARPTEVPASLGIDSFYKKYIDADGIPIVSSADVRDEALVRARRVIIQMLSKRADIKQYMVEKGCKVMIVGEKEEVCDIPEYAHICNTPENIAYWNRRARGFGGAPEHEVSASCGEENVLGLLTDRYMGESILVHEFAHILHMVGICGTEADFNDKLESLRQNAIAKGLWKDTYCISNKEEYFAETVQSFFNCNRYAKTANGVHNSINTREKLKQYDPDMYRLLLQYLPEEDLDLVDNNKCVSWNSPQAGNPIILGYFADPTVCKFGDTYYICATPTVLPEV
jgi:alpha-glucosidase